jgi:hypothetical protein
MRARKWVGPGPIAGEQAGHPSAGPYDRGHNEETFPHQRADAETAVSTPHGTAVLSGCPTSLEINALSAMEDQQAFLRAQSKCGNKVELKTTPLNLDLLRGPTMFPSMNYSGYLSEHLDLIRAAHARGEGSHAIAEELYLAGARAQTSEPGVHELSPDHHLRNLQTMTLHVLRQLGLHVRKSRHLDARCGRDGVWVT